MADDPTTAPETPVGDEAPVTDPNPNNASGGTLDDDDKPLGPKGEKALEAMKAERAELKAAKAKLEAELEELRQAQMTEQEKALEQAKREAADAARAEALGTANSRLFRAELKAATAGQLLPAAAQDLLVDADVALKLLGLGEYPVTAEGDIDSEAISQAVASYIEARPHLAASATPTPGPIDQGARTTSTAQPSLDEQILEAERAGDWKRAGSLKNQKLIASRG